MLNLYPTTHQPDLLVKICVEVFMCYIVQKNKTSLTKCKIARSSFTFSALISIVVSLLDLHNYYIYIIT